MLVWAAVGLGMLLSRDSRTGFLFQGAVDARLSVRNGPFVNPRCRPRDRFDLDALKIGDTPKVLPGR